MRTPYVLGLVFLYTDPGTGILILQLLAAAFIGALFYLRRFKDALFVWKDRVRKGSKEGSRAAALDHPKHSGAKLEPSALISTERPRTE